MSRKFNLAKPLIVYTSGVWLTRLRPLSISASLLERGLTESLINLLASSLISLSYRRRSTTGTIWWLHLHASSPPWPLCHQQVCNRSAKRQSDQRLPLEMIKQIILKRSNGEKNAAPRVVCIGSAAQRMIYRTLPFCSTSRNTNNAA